MTNETRRLCIDCKHCQQPSGFAEIPLHEVRGFSKCLRSAKPFDPVTGETDYHYCESERLFGKCGVTGVNFEPIT